MPKKVIVRTAKTGDTASARRVLEDVDDVTAEPSASGDGVLLQRNEFLHLFFKVEGTSPVFSIQIWWYSPISGQWHKGEAMNVNDNDLATIEVQGLTRMYLQVTAVSGTIPVLNTWVGLVVPA